MSGQLKRPAEETLHAYVDGFLDPAEATAVEQYLADNPGEALRIEAYRRQNEALQLLRELPEQRPFAMPERPRRWAWNRVQPLALRAVAALVLVALGAAGGWLMRDQLQPREVLWQRIVQQAEVAHLTYVPEKLHPVEVTSDQQQHLGNWLSNRLGATISVPMLFEHGFNLVGGRLLPANPGPAAQFMYEDRTGKRLTLYVLAAPNGRKEDAFHYVQKGSLWICYWMGSSIDFAITGEVTRAEMVEMAKTISFQLTGAVPQSANDSW